MQIVKKILLRLICCIRAVETAPFGTEVPEQDSYSILNEVKRRSKLGIMQLGCSQDINNYALVILIQD